MAGDLPRLALTRRRLLLGASAIAANALVVACGGGSNATNASPSLPSTTAAVPISATATAASTATTLPVASTAVPITQSTVAAIPAATATLPAVPVAETFVPPTGTPATPLIVFVGASMVYGLGVERTETFPAQTIALLAPAKYDALNLGVKEGVTLAELLPQAPKTIDPLYAASRSKNILVLGGTNDLGAGATVDEAFAKMVTFCQARRKVGFRVVILTILPNSVALSGGRTYENERQRYNTLMRTNLPKLADAMADVSADPTIGVAGAQLNREYYQSDGTHPTAKTYRIVAGIVKAAILTL